LANAITTADQAIIKERLATLLLSLSRYIEAEEYLLELCNVADVQDDPRWLLAIRSKLTTVSRKLGSKPLEALIEEALALAEQAKVQREHEIQVEMLKDLQALGHHAGKRDLVLSAVESVSGVVDIVSGINAQVTALTFTANAICVYKGTSASLSYAEDAVQRAEADGNEHAMIIALSSRGLNRMQAGMLSHAEDDFRAALALIHRIAAVLHQQFVMNCYGVLLLERGDYEDARRILSDAIEQAAAAAASADQLLATGNLLLVEYESGNISAAEALSHEVLSLSQQAPFLWATIGAWSILGVYALERGDLASAREYREEIMEYAAGRDFWGSDASYTEIFFARLRVAEGDEDGALARLGEAIEAYTDRDFFCRSRLQLERARLLLVRDPAAAGLEAAEVRARGKESGSRLLITRADAILDRIQQLVPR
jgi:tetratricopeptide (TPR) repeat protein